MMVVLQVVDLLASQQHDVFLWELDGTEVIPPLLDSSRFHAFISHNWGTGQDQARTIKAQLSALVPDLKIWLDVDNMRSKAGTSATDKEHFEQLIDSIEVRNRSLPLYSADDTCG